MVVTVVTVLILCSLRLHCSSTVVTVVTLRALWWGSLVMLLVVALWWHCGDTVFIVVVTVFIVVALVVRWSLLVSQDFSVTAFRAPGILETCGSYIDPFFPSV